MAKLEDEIRELREKNNELVQKVQHWKVAAAQREDEKIGLMKELNDLRLKLSHIRNSSGVKLTQLEATIQAGNEKVLALLVHASNEIANIMDATKKIVREIQEPEVMPPRWSAIGGTPASEKPERVHRVPPTLVGGRSIQPVVSLSRTLINSSSSLSRSPNRNRNQERALPIHMLQDVYIPLIRVDAEMRGNIEVNADRNDDLNNSAVDLELEDDSQRLSEVEGFESSPQLDVVVEDLEAEENALMSSRLDDGLEGPSWLLDPPTEERAGTSNSRSKDEPDSTTEIHGAQRDTSTSPRGPTAISEEDNSNPGVTVRVSCEFTPTVRRRKRAAAPSPPSNSPIPRHSTVTARNNGRNSEKDRVLKVMVTKMCLKGDEETNADLSPPKRPKPERLMSFDAPSPSGATDSRVIVSDTREIEPEIVVSPICHVTVRSRRDKQRQKIIEHTYWNEQQEGPGQSEGNDREQLNRNELNITEKVKIEPNSNEHSGCSDLSESESLSRKDHLKRREYSRNDQNKYASDCKVNSNAPVSHKQTDHNEGSSLNDHCEGSASSERSNQFDCGDGTNRSKHEHQSDHHSTEHRSGNEHSHRSARHERRVRKTRQGSKDRSDRRDCNDLPEQSDHDRQEHRSQNDLSGRNQLDQSDDTEYINRTDRSGRVRQSSRDSSDSESVTETIMQGRLRRQRKNITYTEKPLNRKMRR